MALTFQNKDAWDALQPGGFFPELRDFQKIAARVICIVLSLFWRNSNVGC